MEGRRPFYVRFLDLVERVGNLLPHPFWMFLWLIGALLVVSELAVRLEWSQALPRELGVAPRSLLRADALEWFVLNMVENFGHFEPLSLVLVMLMGVAVAEGAGLITAVMRLVALTVPRRWVTPVLFGLAACGNVGSDAGVVVMPPLAAAVFRQMGRNPVVGVLVGYVGATAGFTANLVPAGTDVLAMSLTNAATDGEPEVTVLANWYFMVASVFFLCLLGTLVTKYLVEPRFASEDSEADAEVSGLSQQERRGIGWAVLAIVAVGLLWSLTIVPTGGILREEDPVMFWRSPFFKGMIPILFSLFVVGGVAYGYTVQTIQRADDILVFMSDAMRRMGPYIVLILAISQFTEAFQYTRLDQLVAFGGAELLQSIGIRELPIPFFVAFIVAVATANLFMGSASAKWAIFAPVFVPMFMQLGFHPAFTQLLYRVGDSITNCVSPLYPFFPLLLGWISDIDPRQAQVGTVLSYLVPYAAVLLIGWTLMMILWFLLGLPVGPDSPIYISS
ncbi:MAG: AbgT family transporter [Myxococcota bacterium]